MATNAEQKSAVSLADVYINFTCLIYYAESIWLKMKNLEVSSIQYVLLLNEYETINNKQVKYIHY